MKDVGVFLPVFQQMNHYKVIREGEEPVRIEPCTHLEWAMQWANLEHQLWKAKTEDGHAYVSTILLGFDANFGRFDKPALFESAVYSDGGGLEPILRYSTFEQAKAGHEELVKTWRTVVLGI